MVKLKGTASFVLLATLAVVGCEDGGPTSPTAPTTLVTDRPVVTPPSDFVGRVVTPITTNRHNNRPVQGVTITVVAGPHSGLQVQTDRDGQYVIPDFDGDELHIRLEKAGHETKRVIVHWGRPTTLMDGKRLGYFDGPQKTPGTVLIGLDWPSAIRNVLQHMPIVPDPILVLGGGPGNWYANGVVEVINLNNLKVMAHELCHSHQHSRLSPHGATGSIFAAWSAHSEGRAYIRARQADWDDPEVGKAEYDLNENFSTVFEGAAETCARWWNVDRRPKYTRAWLQVNAPNRARWAEEWLTKP